MRCTGGPNGQWIEQFQDLRDTERSIEGLWKRKYPLQVRDEEIPTFETNRRAPICAMGILHMQRLITGFGPKTIDLLQAMIRASGFEVNQPVLASFFLKLSKRQKLSRRESVEPKAPMQADHQRPKYILYGNCALTGQREFSLSPPVPPSPSHFRGARTHTHLGESASSASSKSSERSHQTNLALQNMTRH
jgi:hypothetical protein